jgi:ELWxxDGT repeat protein
MPSLAGALGGDAAAATLASADSNVTAQALARGLGTGSGGDVDEGWRLALVRDWLPGAASGWPQETTAHAGLLFFTLNGAGARGGRGLWSSDGTPFGFAPVMASPPTICGSSDGPGTGAAGPAHLRAVGSSLYFTSEGLDTGWMLATDSCGGFRASAAAAGVRYAVSASAVWDPAASYDCPDGYHWANTEEARALFPGRGIAGSAAARAVPGAAAPAASAATPAAHTPAYADQCGWVGLYHAGSARRFFRLADSRTTGAFKDAALPDDAPLVAGDATDTSQFAGVLCMEGTAGVAPACGAGRELWRIADGTPAGTRRVADVAPGSAGSNPSAVVPLAQAGGASPPLLLFAATLHPFGRELFASDGTASGTRLLQDVLPGAASSAPAFITGVPGAPTAAAYAPGSAASIAAAAHAATVVLFTADDGVHGRELWATSGAPFPGTRLVADLAAGPVGSAPHHLYAVPVDTQGGLAGQVFFAADDRSSHGVELWITDVSAAGTRMVADVCPGAAGSYPSAFADFGGRVFFAANDCTHQPRAALWVTDGTAAGTRLVTAAGPARAPTAPQMLTVFTPIVTGTPALYFVAAPAGAREATAGSQLWSTTDGATARPVLDDEVTVAHFDVPAPLSVAQAEAGSALPALVAFRDALFLTARRRTAAAAAMAAASVDAIAGASSASGGGETVSFTLADPDATAGDARYTVRVATARGKGSVCLLAAGDASPTARAAAADVLVTEGEALTAAVANVAAPAKAACDPTVEFTAGLAAARALLASIQFVAEGHSTGEDAVTVTVTVTGTAADGQPTPTPRQGNASAAVWIQPVNTPPSVAVAVLPVPVAGWGAAGTVEAAAISAAASQADPVPAALGRPLFLRITVADEDVEDGAWTDGSGRVHAPRVGVTLSVAAGRLGLASRRGLTLLKGDGVADATVSLLGALSDVNAALAALEYVCEPPACQPQAPDGSGGGGGRDVIVVTVDDNGHTGRGGALTARVELHIELS